MAGIGGPGPTPTSDPVIKALEEAKAALEKEIETLKDEVEKAKKEVEKVKETAKTAVDAFIDKVKENVGEIKGKFEDLVSAVGSFKI